LKKSTETTTLRYFGSLEVLATFGGFEIAMMTGTNLKAAELGMLILVDGFIASTA